MTAMGPNMTEAMMNQAETSCSLTRSVLVSAAKSGLTFVWALIAGALFALLVLAALAFSSSAFAATEAQKPTVENQKSGVGALSETTTQKKEKKKSTEVSFEDVLVQGKYHFSDEAVTTVEQDKVLDALLGVRTDFKDRLSKSAARH